MILLVLNLADYLYVASIIVGEGMGDDAYWVDLEAISVQYLVYLWSRPHFTLRLEYGMYYP